jgi:hypothetical protein
MRCAFLLVVMTGCAMSSPVGNLSQAVGEQQNGFPNPWERALFMAANRARSDPSTVKGSGSTIYPPTAPLVLTYDLERSARFHAVNLDKGPAPLMHESPCTLRTDVGTSGCDGTPSCACTTGATCMTCGNCPAGTGPFERIGYFYAPGGNGEIISAGYGDPWQSMDGFVDEAAGQDGHRQIVDGKGYGVVGFGHAAGAPSECYGSYDAGDFASQKPTPPKIASAAPKPIDGPAGTFRIYATWADPAGGAPKDLSAVVDGACTTVTLEFGKPSLNATYYADVPLSNGCHSVYVLGHDSGGTRVTYPTSTAFTIAVGGGSCAEEVAQPQASCEGGPPGGGGPPAGGGPPDLASGNSDGGTTPGGNGGGNGGNGGGGNGGNGGNGNGGNGGGGNGGNGGNGNGGNGNGGSGGNGDADLGSSGGTGGNGADNGGRAVIGGCSVEGAGSARLLAPIVILLLLTAAARARRLS